MWCCCYVADDEEEEEDPDYADDDDDEDFEDPDQLYCICRQPHNQRSVGEIKGY